MQLVTQWKFADGTKGQKWGLSPINADSAMYGPVFDLFELWPFDAVKVTITDANGDKLVFTEARDDG